MAGSHKSAAAVFLCTFSEAGEGEGGGEHPTRFCSQWLNKIGLLQETASFFSLKNYFEINAKKPKVEVKKAYLKSQHQINGSCLISVIKREGRI